jgi:hypothetical protein
MQKMARDRLKRFVKDAKASGQAPPGTAGEEAHLCAALAGRMASAKGDKRAEAAIWDQEWRTVYALAEATMKRTLAEFGSPRS